MHKLSCSMLVLSLGLLAACGGETSAGGQNGSPLNPAGAAGVAGAPGGAAGVAGSGQSGAGAGGSVAGSAGSMQGGAAGAPTSCESPNTRAKICAGGKVMDICLGPTEGAPAPFVDCGGETCVNQGESCPNTKICGGLLGAQCSEGEYCKFEEAAQCGAGDQTGICTPKPTACDLGCPAPEFQPCGCDGQKYCSECDAASKGVSLTVCPSTKICGGIAGLACAADEYCKYDEAAQCGAADQTGVCTPKPTECPVGCAAPEFQLCGCDGQKYCSECVAALQGVSVTACPTAKACGGKMGLTCADGEYCKYDEAAQCGAFDATGTCAPMPKNCDASCTFVPLCGCDGNTYCNECEAASKGISLTACKPTACESPNTPAQVCVNGSIQDICLGPNDGAPAPIVDCGGGTCVNQGESCPNTKICGGIAGLACGADEYCKYDEAAQCGAADQTGVCTPRPTECGLGCPAPEFQLCGCDGQKYCSECAAAANGVSVTACPTAKACGGKMGLTCADGEYCKYDEAAQCGAFDATGTCAPMPKNCDASCTFVPLCGCDGNTYCNECEAASKGISLKACP